MFDNVTFGYTVSDPVLKGFTLDVAPGETVALVGASGSGKSTVALLLPRFYDAAEGSITIDGVNVRDVTLDSLRRGVGVVFEDPFLFSDSLRANIAYGRPDATDDEIDAAAAAAEADTFIRALPRRLRHRRGRTRPHAVGRSTPTCRARRAPCITDPSVLVLDDATSSIDAKTEEEIHETLRHLMAGRTTILVAHRRSTLRLADRIVVVDDGAVADMGTHEELMRAFARCTARCSPAPTTASKRSSRTPPVDTAAASTASRPRRGRTRSRPTARAPPRRTGTPRIGGPGGRRRLRPGARGDARTARRARRAAAGQRRPEIDVAAEAQPRDSFSSATFIAPYRKWLGIGFALVAFDVVVTLLGPLSVRTASTTASATTTAARLRGWRRSASCSWRCSTGC